jgi:hypothetical protein
LKGEVCGWVKKDARTGIVVAETWFVASFLAITKTRRAQSITATLPLDMLTPKVSLVPSEIALMAPGLNMIYVIAPKRFDRCAGTTHSRLFI